MIRRAVYADIPQLRRLFAMLAAELEAGRAVAYPVHTPDDLDAFTLWTARRLEVDPTFLCYLAEDDATGAAVGFLGGEICERALGTPHIFCAAHWLYIEPAARGQGYGRGLVRLGCEDLAAAGITHVEVGSIAGDPQWVARGWQPYLVHHVLPLAAVFAGAAPERPAPPPPVPVAPPVLTIVPPPKRRRPHRRTRPLPVPPRAEETGT